MADSIEKQIGLWYLFRVVSLLWSIQSLDGEIVLIKITYSMDIIDTFKIDEPFPSHIYFYF